MGIPPTNSMLLPFLRIVADGNPHTLKTVAARLHREMRLTLAQLGELQPSGIQTRFEKRLGWAKYYLNQSGLIRTTSRGNFQITEAGQRLLRNRPKGLRVNAHSRIEPAT